MYDSELLKELGLSAQTIDDLAKPLMDKITAFMYASIIISILMLAVAIWYFGFYQPRKRKQEMAQLIGEQLTNMSKRIESIYALRLEELGKTMARQTEALEEALRLLKPGS
jgi:hypothetical protein